MKTALNLGGEALVDCQDQLVEARLAARQVQESLATAEARAEHWAGQADRLARQVEAMRAVMLEVAEQISDSERGAERWAERLRRAAKGGSDE